jgi:hypothetical protein
MLDEILEGSDKEAHTSVLTIGGSGVMLSLMGSEQCVSANSITIANTFRRRLRDGGKFFMALKFKMSDLNQSIALCDGEAKVDHLARRVLAIRVQKIVMFG